MHIKQNPDERHEYALTLTWTGAKQGATTSYQAYSREYEFHAGDRPPMRGSADPHFRGDPGLYSPEDLLVAALSSCHMLSYLALCARAGVHVEAYGDEATGTMTVRDGRVRFTDVTLRPRVVVARSADLEKARALHHDAHAECYIANSVNFPVANQPTVTVAEGTKP